MPVIFIPKNLTLSESKPLVKPNWKETWRNKHFRVQFIVTILYIFCIASFFRYFFFDFIEARDGKQLSDPILSLIPAKDVSRIVFISLYSGMALSIIYLVMHPLRLLLALETYCMVMTLRVISIGLLPLLPPVGYIPLREPVAQFFTFQGRIISKDLFFSGHMSTIMSLFYPLQNKFVKRIVLFLSIMVGVLVLVQHVHYTIDVLTAPLATYVCYLFSKRVTAKIKL